MTGSFGDVQLDDVVGYRISVAWVPNDGFDWFFYVYVWDKQEAGTRFPQVVQFQADGKPTRGSLQIIGAQRRYTFQNIDLMSAQIGATRRFRYRLLEFRYDKAVISTGATPVTIQNDATDKVNVAGLGADYQYAVGGDSEPLLGFRYRPAAAGANVVRFCALRNNQNCFLAKLIAANNNRNQNADNSFSAFTVNAPQGIAINVTQQNLQTMYLDESFGYMLGENLPPLSSLVSAAPDIMLQAVQLKLEDYFSRQLLAFDSQQTAPVGSEADKRTVETATFVFIPGNYQNLAIA